MIIELINVKKAFKKKGIVERILFENLNFSFDDRLNSIAIMGRSGSGKTTLLNIISGLDIKYEGTYKSEGLPLVKTTAKMAKYRYNNIAIISQKYDLLFDRNVMENIMIGSKKKKASAKSDAIFYLDLVGLKGYENKKIYQLSGGEQQRVVIARALAKEPSLLIADEPTGALDEESEEKVLEIFKNLSDGGTKIIMVTHSPKVASFCDVAFIIKDKNLVLKEFETMDVDL
ncbi:ABC transporter ATP-binding protein [Lactococcus lactis]|uniref:ABC transporter ATP-binding protein n=1 Tax=Lactococcus lactis TaxID=1358 RepID=A0AAP5PF27_9LACT|nr:ABC transporter ATP-binding protein [Lactococcus lactis]MDT2860542.1 ABC transporter ATP-binding protein [Lactococcus lactis]MDT2863328.1 ABC transporter ATP-binding protein [Lactococcus lactis]MDT2868706.1 ABC transporter ATP-binding protein [Lactococcus lactis]MDT2871556.1 ABC transporter ATP-binding protein [Lactococcus lactis]MDT2874207.1 ABC transporter ATP-binding protein [Lactococcus lactis]